MPNQFLSPEGDLEDYFVDEYWLIDQYIGDTLWTWGYGTQGNLGDNTTVNRSTPVTTSAGGSTWQQVAGGRFQTTAIKTDGTLWVWGFNSNGQLGINATTNRSTPVQTSLGGTNWKQVSGGGYHTTAIKTDGTLWTWGYGKYGQLGVNDTNNRCTPVQTSLGGTNWKQVAGGRNHTAAIKTDGTLWVWGRNVGGPLGDNTTVNRCTPVTTSLGGTNWKQVSGGSSYTAAIKTDGTLWTWGLNTNGNLGVNDTNNRCTPVQTSLGGTNWKQVSCGDGHTAAIKTDGTLWTWGANSSGQLGDNTTVSRSTPVTTSLGGTNWKQVAGGSSHTTAIKTDGTLWTWGFNSSGQLGINNVAIRSTPVQTSLGGTNWKQVSCGSVHTTAITAGIDAEYPLS